MQPILQTPDKIITSLDQLRKSYQFQIQNIKLGRGGKQNGETTLSQSHYLVALGTLFTQIQLLQKNKLSDYNMAVPLAIHKSVRKELEERGIDGFVAFLSKPANGGLVAFTKDLSRSIDKEFRKQIGLKNERLVIEYHNEFHELNQNLISALSAPGVNLINQKVTTPQTPRSVNYYDEFPIFMPDVHIYALGVEDFVEISKSNVPSSYAEQIVNYAISSSSLIFSSLFENNRFEKLNY